MAWLWFINSDVVEGARWLGDALGATGPRRPELAATAQVWHGYCVCMAYSPAAAVPECDAALAALRTSDDQTRRAEALLFCATVLMRAQEHERSLDALSQAHDLLDPGVHGWQLAVHDWIVAWNLTLLGQFDDAEQAARSSVERFDTQGEVWLPVDPLNILAGIAAARGDLDGASAAYEALLERCRAAGQRNFVLFILQRLAALRARQGDDDAADGLYEEAIACSFNPSYSADVMVGQAAVARRLGDLARARALLDAAGTYYRNVGLRRRDRCPRRPGVVGTQRGPSRRGDDLCRRRLPGRRRQRGPGHTTARRYRRSRSQGARRPDPPQHRGLHRARSAARPELAVRQLTSFTDEPDVAALAARLALPGRSAATRRRPPRALHLPESFAPPAADRSRSCQVSSRRLTSVSPQRRVRPARQTGIHADTTRSALRPA